MIRNTFIALAVLSCASLYAQDLVEWSDTHRSGIYAESNLLKSWPESEPHLMLEIKDAGNGDYSPVLYKNMIYVSGRKDTLDYTDTSWRTSNDL